MSIMDKIAGISETVVSDEEKADLFYHYEPWDVPNRPEWVLKQAIEDGIDFSKGDLQKFVPLGQHLFQSGYLCSTKFLRIKMGGSQIGKSIDAVYEAIIMLTGELPYSLRYPRGFDTGIKRRISEENIHRFGRFNSETHTFIDNNVHVIHDDNWDCGTIHGAGIYPQEKIAPEGKQIWIGTYQKPFINYWWPKLAEETNRIIPSQFIDKTKGNNGINSGKHTVFLVRGGKIIIITYESHDQAFESEKAWAYIGDEESLDQTIFQSAIQHARYVSLLFTPYNGITWSKSLVFPDDKSIDRDLFHATQYDSPYQSKFEIDKRRPTMKPWDIAARVWGIPTDIHGEPYFDRTKLMNWCLRFRKMFQWKKFEPKGQYFGVLSRPEITDIPGLMDVAINMISCESNRMNSWKVYEDRMPGIAYVLTADPAEGANDPNDAADVCAAMISRPPGKDETRPVIVATLRSTLETIPFARTCSHAMRYYNNALLAAETKRGACNAAFASELRDYPYWYKFTSIQDSTGRTRTQSGFDTNAASRDIMFLLIEEWVGAFEPDEDPGLWDESLMDELAKAVTIVKGKKKRCDHTREGTLDTTICFGILCYVIKHSLDQVKCNYFEPAKKNMHHRTTVTRPVPCGMTFMGYA